MPTGWPSGCTGLILYVAIGIVIDANAHRRRETSRYRLPFVAQDDVAGAKDGRRRIETDVAVRMNIVPVLLKAGAPVNFIPLPGLDALL